MKILLDIRGTLCTPRIPNTSVVVRAFYGYRFPRNFLCKFWHIYIRFYNIVITFASDMDKKKNDDRRHHLGALLKHERKCRKIEQVDLALKLGVSQKYISKIEASQRRIDVLELIDYSMALNLSLTEFAWKIEDYLYGLGLLPFPKNYIKKIRVEVSWIDNKFFISFTEFLKGTNTFVELQKVVEEYFNSIIKGMVANDTEAPRWFVNKQYEFEYQFLDVTSLLKTYSSYISLAVISRASGINQSMLSQYANGLKKASTSQQKRIADAIHKIGKDLMAVFP